jgi:hypothetical protein
LLSIIRGILVILPGGTDTAVVYTIWGYSMGMSDLLRKGKALPLLVAGEGPSFRPGTE